MQPLQFRVEMFQFIIRCHNFPFMVFRPRSVIRLRLRHQLRGVHGHPRATVRRQMCFAGAGETLHRLLSFSPVVPADAVQQVGLIAPRANTASTKLWTNKKVAEFGASKVTPAPFQSGQQDR